MSSAKLHLTSEEALVFIDFLIRFRDEEKLIVVNPAEEQLLWDLCAMLESQVPELIHKDYKRLLEEARKAIIAGDNIN